MPFCGNCGAPVDPGKMRFCPRCGTPVEAEFAIPPPPVPPASPTTTNPPSPTTKLPPPPPTTMQGGLFDPRRNGYVIHEKTWDWGGGDILDERGNKIGYMDRKILSLRAEIKLTEVNGIVAAKIHRKIVAVRPTYEIKDASDQTIGKIEKKLLSLRPKLYVLDAGGDKLLEIKGNFIAWDFTIKNIRNGNEVGTVQKLDRWKDVFFGGGIFDRSDKYALKIYGNIDRRLVVGAVIAIDNMFHDESD
ncbi:MAG: LURP-one-related family protein [Promethearchaeota archaeon]